MRALELQVGHLCAWKANQVLDWLVTNPDGTDDPNKQKSDLLRALRGAGGPERMAAVVLNAIYARQRADNPALQPAASELR